MNTISDREILSYLYTMNLLNVSYNSQETETQIENKKLQSKNMELQTNIDQFWESFDDAIQTNKRGADGKQRILSIITEKYGHRAIKNKLWV